VKARRKSTAHKQPSDRDADSDKMMRTNYEQIHIFNSKIFHVHHLSEMRAADVIRVALSWVARLRVAVPDAVFRGHTHATNVQTGYSQKLGTWQGEAPKRPSEILKPGKVQGRAPEAFKWNSKKWNLTRWSA
jgi:hypothetical protein